MVEAFLLSCDQNLMAIGIFGKVHLLNKTVVRKVPLSSADTQPIRNEATIYAILGDHPRIANCLSKGEIGINYVDVEYYPNCNLLSYLKKNASRRSSNPLDFGFLITQNGSVGSSKYRSPYCVLYSVVIIVIDYFAMV